jgi:3-deoxy-D-manno-octulosonate 8-phosphate phosphatase (KDO 8-P phosphatase)
MKRTPAGARLRAIRMLILDVDGVLTDAGMYYSEAGDELKKFDTRDGHGITLLREAGLITAIVTRERTNIVSRRAQKLKIEECHQGVFDKLPVVKDLLARYGLTPEQACYIGDDVGDLDAMRHVGLPIAVADAMPPIKRVATYVTRARGGAGAVREVCDLILAARRSSR